MRRLGHACLSLAAPAAVPGGGGRGDARIRAARAGREVLDGVSCAAR